MHTRAFLPSPRATNVLVAIGFVTLGCALYVRYLLIENSTVGLACEGGLATMQCLVRQAAIFMFRRQVFGILAIAAAVYHLLQPNLHAFTIALAAGMFGLVLYNNSFAALAVALLVISFARPVAVDKSPKGPAEGRQTTSPANSTPFH